MGDLFKLKIVHSQSHWFFPKIIIGILIVLGLILIIQGIVKAKKENRPFIQFKGKRFFVEDYDKVKLFGTVILFVLYIIFLNIVGFIIAGIIFITLFNILYATERNVKQVVVSVIISTIASVVLWFIFGYIFNVTLP